MSCGNYNALVLAIINSHYDVAGYLLEHGANPNIADKYGRAALYAAVDMHMLEKSATRPDPKETDKTTSLDVVRIALDHGADPNARGEGTPLYAAESTEQPDLIALLRERGAHE